MSKSPDFVDKYVGERIRLRRHLLGMSQGKLASSLGLTFQQVQKYERGANRVGAGRLFEISKILGVDVSYFFNGLSYSGASDSSGSGNLQPGTGMADSPSKGELFLGAFSKNEVMVLSREFSRLDSSKRRLVLNLIRTLASDSD